MRIIIKNLIKFLLILSVFFVIFFFSIILYHSIIFLKVGSKDLLISFLSLIKPSFFHAFYNSFIWSSVFFVVFILYRKTKQHLLIFFIPVILSLFFFGIFHLIFRPTPNTLAFNKLNDLRILFAKKTFFQYKDYTLFFRKVKQNEVNDIIIIKDNKVHFIKKAKATFLEDAVLLKFSPDSSIINKIFFPRQSLMNYSSYISVIPKLLIKWMTNLSYLFVLSNHFIINIFLWVSFIFFIVSFFDLVKLKDFLLLSFLINFLLIFIIYFLINNFYLFYKTVAFSLVGQSFLREIIFGAIISFFGLILFGIKILFIKEDNK